MFMTSVQGTVCVFQNRRILIAVGLTHTPPFASPPAARSSQSGSSVG